MVPPLHFEPPRGMRDFYPEDLVLRRAVFNAWTQAALCFGFDQYDSCVVESLELLKRKGGEEIVEQIYAFKDKSDRDLALRPEMTPTLARMIVARQGLLAFPLKWFAIAQCFRYERTTKGRKREHYQWNLDIVGENSLSAEAEVLACALTALAALGLSAQDVRVHYNSRALLADLFLKAGIAAEQHAAVFLALDKRGKIPDEEVVVLLEKDGLNKATIEAAFKILAINTLEAVRDFLGTETPALAAIAELPRRLTDYGLNAGLCFDIGVVRGLGYYTGIVFEAYAVEHKMRAIFGGGRYDRLLSDIGGNACARAPAREISAVGLGFGDVVIADLLQAKGAVEKITKADRVDLAIGFMEAAQRTAAVRLAQAWRKNGKMVDLALHPEKPKHFFARVGKGGITEAAYIGPDDLASGAVRLKNLHARTEKTIPLN